MNNNNNNPILKTVKTNGNDSDRQNIKIMIVRIFNISTIAFYGIAVFLFFLSFIFFEKLQFRITLPVFYWSILGLSFLTFIGFIEHIIFLFLRKKKKKLIKDIEFAVTSFSVIIFLLYQLLIFTIYQHLDKSLRNFWEKHGIDENIQKIETSLNCCGYDLVESRCKRRSKVSCSNMINSKFMDQQYPIAFAQMAFTILLFIFLMELISCSIKKSKRKHHHHHQKQKDEDEQQREMPLSPEQL